MQKLRPLKSAWLVTWEWMSEHARVETEKRIVAVLNYRWSGKRVLDFVENLYVAIKYSAWEKVDCAGGKTPRTRHPAQFMTIQGVPWDGEIHCGDHPWLKARRVKNLRVTIHDDGREETLWDEIPIPTLPKRFERSPQDSRPRE